MLPDRNIPEPGERKEYEVIMGCSSSRYPFAKVWLNKAKKQTKLFKATDYINNFCHSKLYLKNYLIPFILLFY